MGLSYEKLLLKNPRKHELQGIDVSALADTGATHLSICWPY